MPLKKLEELIRNPQTTFEEFRDALYALPTQITEEHMEALRQLSRELHPDFDEKLRQELIKAHWNCCGPGAAAQIEQKAELSHGEDCCGGGCHSDTPGDDT